MAERGIQLKSRGELQAMRASGLVLAAAIVAGRAAVAPGVSTLDINDAVAAVIAEGFDPELVEQGLGDVGQCVEGVGELGRRRGG